MTLSQRGFLLASLLCSALACLPFLAGLPGAFVLDDIRNIVENSGLRLQSLAPGAIAEAAFSPQPGSTTRFIPMLTFALDYYRAGGLDPATFKTTSIAVHLLTVLALIGLLFELLKASGWPAARARWGALIMALAWAMHPLQVSSVLYVVQRMQTLATLFIVLALLAYLQARRAQMQGRAGRTGWIVTGLLWVLAIGCKEDAVLLPAYLLALELTVLQFRAADAGLARRLRRGYATAVVLGAAAYLLVVLPHYWSWDDYPRRDFSSPERLLTQGRVLCLYLWQILVPLPSHMPFYYDGLHPSQGLLQPWTTLPALLALLTLVAVAWRVRHRRPLFSLGILLFFAGHFVTSNVIALELAFEHRNHFPLIGIVIAASDLLVVAAQRLRIRPPGQAAIVIVLLASLAGAATLRARSWDAGVALATTSTRLAPDSIRAWNSLCVEWYDLGGGPKTSNPYLGKAIPACRKAAAMAPDSVASLTNVITFKSLQGSATKTDWDAYLTHLRQVPMNGENVSTMWALIGSVREGIPLDHDGVLSAIDIICNRVQFGATDYAAIGVFILDQTDQPDRAYPYLERAARLGLDPGFSRQLAGYLVRKGRTDWADRLFSTLPPSDRVEPR